MSTSQASSPSMKCSKEASTATEVSGPEMSGLCCLARLPLPGRSENIAPRLLGPPPIHVISPAKKTVYQTQGQTVPRSQKTTAGVRSLVSTSNKAVPLERRDTTLSDHCDVTYDVLPFLSPGIFASLVAIQAEDGTVAAASSTFLRRSFQRSQALRYPPALGKVYYMPDGRSIPSSIIHHQQRNSGFFNHPVLVTGVEGGIAHFYALTRAPPQAIGQLSMCLRLGTTSWDAGAGVLKLASGSAAMRKETWVNLERRFSIEWENLEIWAGNVTIDRHDLWKLWGRVAELEADQNRYLYKPLPRDMTCLRPGSIVLMPNEAGASTLGAPVLVVDNLYPQFRFLRVKIFEENMYFNPATKRKHVQPRHMCLEISRRPKMGHDGTPVMLLEPESPAMRQPSYVEVFPQAKMGNLEECKTWCWPPVLIRRQSMLILHHYMATSASQLGTFSLGPPVAVGATAVGWSPGLSRYCPINIAPHGSGICDHGHMAEFGHEFRATWTYPPRSPWTPPYPFPFAAPHQPEHGSGGYHGHGLPDDCKDIAPAPLGSE